MIDKGKEQKAPKNDAQNEKSEKLSDTPKSYSKDSQKTKLAQAQHALKYGIAALSLVSFFTTSRGLEEIVSPKYAITPYLISFGIQVIVLVVGTRLANILKNISMLEARKFIRVFVAICALVPYITSVGFSSFFSYTFLSNQAYERVRETDYNIKIENFLNEEFANLDNLNDAAGKVILVQVQSYIPQINNILQQFHAVASNEIGNIKSTIILNQTATIPEDAVFSTDTITDASEAQLTRLRIAENTLRTSANTYANYYSNYKSNFDMLINTENLESINNSIETVKARIESDIQSMREQQRVLNEQIQDSTNRYNMMLKNSASTISSYFESLIASENNLLQAYNLIDTNESINSGTIDLQNIYNTIYSTTDVSDDDVAQAIQDLQSIITSYLNQAHTDNLDNESLQNLSNCITYLGEFQKYKNLSGQLDAFEADVLSKVYVIEYPTTTSKVASDIDSTTTDNTVFESTTAPTAEVEVSTELDTDSTTSSIELQVTRVSQESWNETRREDLGKFINMVKSLPNFETIINFSSDTPETRQYIRLLEKNTSYRTDTLEEAYKLNRQNLEEISSIEKARNYLHSDFRYMAFYCLCVAVFLDLSSLFVGLFIFFTDGKEKMDTEISTSINNDPNTSR